MNQSLRILHVDDDPDFLDLTADFLAREAECFEVVTEASPRDALARLGDRAVDCVVSDYRMPGMDGLELLEAVREEYPDLPFILFTNRGSEQVAADAIEKGVTSYLQKEAGGTVQYAMLANRIRNHVERYRAEQQARSLKREHELVAKTATDVFWTFDPGTGSVSVSEGVEHFGYGHDPDSGRDVDWFFTRVHPDDRDRLRRLTEALLAREEVAFDVLTPERGQFSTELRFQRADGTYADCQVRGNILFDGDDPTEVIGTVTDVTERRQRERELEETTRTLEAVIEATPNAMILIDGDGTVERWNPAAEQLFGWTQGEVLGEALPIVPADRESEFDGLGDQVWGDDGSPVRNHDTRRQRKDGTLIDVCLSAAPIRDEFGDITGAMAIMEDISERKAYQRALERERDRRAALFENTPDPIMEVRFEDGTPHIDGVNRAFEDVFGLDAGEAVDRVVADAVVPESEREEHDKHQANVLQGEQVEAEVRRETATGIREFLLRIIPIDVEDISSGAYAWYTDITDRKERERELKRQNERLDEFASVISHDLRNPMNVAEGQLELARTECGSEHLDAVERAHDRIQQLIDDLLTLAREGETPSEVEPVDLAEAAETGWRNVETGAAELVVQTERTVRADRSRLTQLFENLFRNSVEHGSTSPGSQARQDSVEGGSTGSRTVSGDGLKQAGADVSVTVGDLAEGFYVADDGPGIDPDDRDRVFESGYSTSQDGTGFGLSIVAEIVSAHGWEIRAVESSGARFEITGTE